jgi:hypothetical protein
MSNSTQLYSQVLGYLRQYSTYRDLRHLKTLAWMINGLICSGQLSLSAWEPYVDSYAKQAQSYERRWHRFLENIRINVEKIYLPLALLALKDWEKHRLYLALDTTMLWNRFCISYKVWRDGNRHRQLCADSHLSGMLWASNPFIVESIGA